jgi:hypothetical protein
MDTIDISVVLLSEFLDENEENDIKQLKDHVQEGFVKGEKGMLKRVYTHGDLEMCLDFPGVKSPPYSFQIDQPELDSVGFVIDHFKRIVVNRPANGAVKINHQNGSLWNLNVHEMKEETKAEVAQGSLHKISCVLMCLYIFLNFLQLTDGSITSCRQLLFFYLGVCNQINHSCILNFAIIHIYISELLAPIL